MKIVPALFDVGQLWLWQRRVRRLSALHVLEIKPLSRLISICLTCSGVDWRVDESNTRGGGVEGLSLLSDITWVFGKIVVSL